MSLGMTGTAAESQQEWLGRLQNRSGNGRDGCRIAAGMAGCDPGAAAESQREWLGRLQNRSGNGQDGCSRSGNGRGGYRIAAGIAGTAA